MNTTTDLVNLLNSYREKDGIPPLIDSRQLNEAASLHAAYMLQANTLSHTGRHNSRFDQRIADTGYEFSAAAENVACGAMSIKSVVELWMGSPSHRANIMNPSYTEAGVGVAPEMEHDAPENRRYWSLSLAVPNNTAPGEPTSDQATTVDPVNTAAAEVASPSSVTRRPEPVPENPTGQPPLQPPPN